jgi:16S rRNA (guanine966-N2)-methyltransferase
MRIVAGKWGGRSLKAPRGMAVRPTTDRVREALFSILGDRVEGRAVLDPDAFAAMAGNLASVGAASAETFKGDFRKAIRRLALQGRRFGLVFLDPPYGKGLAAAASRALAEAGLLSEDAVVVVEEATRAADSVFPAGWALRTDRRYGDTRVMVFEVPVSPGGGQMPEQEHQCR